MTSVMKYVMESVEPPQKEKLEREKVEREKYWFKICIYREFTAILGKFILMTESGEQIVKSAQLESYHAPEDDNMVAIYIS